MSSDLNYFCIDGPGMTPEDGRVKASPHDVVPDPAMPHHLISVKPARGEVDEKKYPFSIGKYFKWTQTPSDKLRENSIPDGVYFVRLNVQSLDLIGPMKGGEIGPFLIRLLKQSPQFEPGQLEAMPDLKSDEPQRCLDLNFCHTVFSEKLTGWESLDITEEGTVHSVYWDEKLFGDACTLGMLGAVLFHCPPEVDQVAAPEK